MGTDLFKYIFDESKKDGLKGVISVIIKIAAFFICLSPVFVYFLIYQPIVAREYNVFVSSTLIIGCSCILFFIIFCCSKIFASMLLSKKYKLNKKLSYEEAIHYYFQKSLVITTIFQGILTMFIVGNYCYKNSSNINIKQLNELFIIIVIIIAYILLCISLWIYSLLKHIEVLENEKNSYIHNGAILEKGDDFEVKEKVINDALILLEGIRELLENQKRGK